ncbi:MAG: M20 family metallopeptidase [Ruminococcaceae bacterium]|nr:M20 family metallopeptidase [Oscillospiraceae bacterium]
MGLPFLCFCGIIGFVQWVVTKYYVPILIHITVKENKMLNRYLKDLEYIVNIDSGSTDCFEGSKQIADFFGERFKSMGWNVKEHNLEPNAGTCLVCTNREAEKYDLMLIGHTDTVFLKGTVQQRPFRIENNIAYGPGITDMKSGCLLMYYILKELPAEINDKLNIVAVFNPDEEIGSFASREVYKKYAEISDYVYLYEAGSKTGARCTSRKGGYFIRGEFFGVPGHSGSVLTSGARSAVSEAAKWVVALDKLQSLERNTSVNIIIDNGGIKSNIVPEYASIKVDIRFFCSDEIERIDNLLSELLEGAKERKIEVKLERRIKPELQPTEKGKAYIKHIEELAQKNNMEFKHAPRGGHSDANIIAPYGPICIDGMGPAGGRVHAPEEYLNIDTVMPSFELSNLLIKDLADRKGR